METDVYRYIYSYHVKPTPVNLQFLIWVLQIKEVQKNSIKIIKEHEINLYMLVFSKLHTADFRNIILLTFEEDFYTSQLPYYMHTRELTAFILE